MNAVADSTMDTPSKPTLTKDEMVALWTSLRAEVDAEEGGLPDNIVSGCCGDNYDAISSNSGHRAEFCDLWSFANEEGTEWDAEKLAAAPNMQPPPGLDWDWLRDMGWIKQAHVWATLDNRHYDIEAVEGVDNPFDLNDIRRGLVEDLSEKHPDLFARISGHPWWQEAIAMNERTKEALASLGEDEESDEDEAAFSP